LSRKALFAVAGIALAVSACADPTDPFGSTVQHTIEIPGNTLGTAGCVQIDHSGCYAILDNELKRLYETNSTAARRGEAEYRPVSRANKQLAYIFQSEARTAAEALGALDRFIRDISTAYMQGRYSSCWAEQVLAQAEWLRGKIAAGSVDVADAPALTCYVSAPTRVIATGSTNSGVVLMIDDPWHYNGDPYGAYSTQTYFVVAGPSGSISTPPTLQVGAALVTVVDESTKQVGTYQYSVRQCSDWGPCSEPMTFSVTVVEGNGTPTPICVHDNRDGLKPPGQLDGKCPKPIS
jgi:hypothetical protein